VTSSLSEKSGAVANIVPRWEWRTFGDLERSNELLTSLKAVAPVDSDEVYLLSTRSDASVKVRAGLLDVKTLDTVSEHGLQLWIPRIKAAFPLDREAVTTAFEAMNVDVPDLARAAYTLEQLEAELVAPSTDVRAARVHKRRARSLVDDCMVEYTTIVADGSPTDTVAVESPDPALVSITVRKLGLEGRENTCVARGLKDLLGGGRRYAVIDVGTNSVKFHVGERLPDGGETPLVDRADVTRLGEGLAEAGRLTAPAMERTIDAIAAMVEQAHSQGVAAIAAVGTAGLRQAPNREDFVDEVKARCGVTVDVISGEEEGRLAYLAATSSLPVGGGPLVVFDSGGGSSQFTFGSSDAIDERFSLDVGAVRFTERYGLAGVVSRDVLEEALEAIAADLGRLDGRDRPEAVVAIGGTSTNLAAVKHGLESYDPDVVHGTVLDLAEIDRQIELYRSQDADQRRSIAGLQPARAEVILAGACIVRTILTKLGQQAVRVSDRGLRHGVFAERFAR
jgi:exopolyphosphatase/guanosine-5'-triphosphate,3'-diphosphate pyrophosphatase